MSTANAFISLANKKSANTMLIVLNTFLPSFFICTFAILFASLGEEKKIAFDPLVCDLAIKKFT